MSPADVIRQLLIDLGHGTASGAWPISVSFLPNTPDNALCVYDTAGRFDGRIMETGEQVEHPGVQIRIRGLVYPDVWTKVNEIAEALDAQQRTIVELSSDDVYLLHSVSRAGPPIPLGIEEEGDRRRHHFTINAMLTLSIE